MADQTFTAAEREAIWLAHEKKCGYTREPLDVSEFHIDHILPESLADAPVEFERIKSTLGLDDNFQLTGFENLLPCKARPNLQKGSTVFEDCHTHYFLGIAASKKPSVEAHLTKIEQRKKRGRALILLQQCIEGGELSIEEVSQILEQYGDQPSEIFKLLEGLEFADGEVCTLMKADIAELRTRPIRLGRNDHIDGVTLTAPDSNKQIHVRSCLEYDTAIRAGYFAFTTFDMKMAAFFEHQCGLLNALDVARTPSVSYIEVPRVGILDLHLLPFSLFPSIGEEPDPQKVKGTYQDKIDDGTLIVRCIKQNLLNVETRGIGQQLVEAARADFNGDGVEDVLLFEYCYATTGTLGLGGIKILTRKSATSLFEKVCC